MYTNRMLCATSLLVASLVALVIVLSVLSMVHVNVSLPPAIAKPLGLIILGAIPVIALFDVIWNVEPCGAKK